MEGWRRMNGWVEGWRGMGVDETMDGWVEDA